MPLAPLRSAYRGAAPLPMMRFGMARTLLGLAALPAVGSAAAPVTAAAVAHGVTTGLRSTASASQRRAGLSLYGQHAPEEGAGPARISALLARAYAPSTNKQDAGHWRAWERVCAQLGTSPWRTDIAANSGADVEGYNEEVYLLHTALILMYGEMKPRKNSDPAADPRSAVKKLQAVARIHRTLVPPVEMVSLSVVSNVTKGLLREYIDKHGFRTLIPDRKLPLTGDLIDKMLATYAGARRGALIFEPGTYYWTAMLCLFAVLAESGERKDEVTGNKGGNGFTFASLTWKVGGKLYKVLTPELWARMGLGDGVLLAHGLAKNDPFGAFFAATPTFLPWRPLGRCACRSLATLEIAAALSPEARETTPLFGPEVGAYFTGAQVDQAFELLLAQGARVPESELSNYSVHSFRIYLACALLEAGCPKWMIKRMLRWRGDQSLEIYARVSDQQWTKQLTGAMAATVDATLVPRLPTLDFSPSQEAAFQELANAFLGANFHGTGRPSSA